MQDIVELFTDLVRIDSETGHESNLIERVRQIFETDLQAVGHIDSHGNLIATVPAKTSDALPVLLCAHGDTVKPGTGIRPIVENDIIRSEGDTILGADDKAGIAEIYEAIRLADCHPPLEIVITRGEEAGLTGAKNLDYDRLKSSRGVVVDGDDLDEIIIGGPTYFEVDAEIIGHAAHAGMEPEKGLSAIRVAADAIHHMEEGRIDDETTANIGTLEAGSVRNAVPDRAFLSAECRSLNHEKCVAQAKLMEKAILDAAERAGATANVRLNMTIHSSAIPSDSEMVSIAKQAIRAVGLKPRANVIVGGTDASILNEHGIQTIVLGFGGKNAHSTSEEIAITDMKKGALILQRLLESLA